MKQNSTPFFSFVVLLIVFLGGYSYFVYAAAPPGGYNPGDTLNPDCAPGDTDCVVTIGTGGSVTANNGLTLTGSNVQLGGTLIHATAINTAGNDFNVSNGNFNFGISNALSFTGTAGIFSSYQDTTTNSAIGIADFGGASEKVPVLIHSYDDGSGTTSAASFGVGLVAGGIYSSSIGWTTNFTSATESYDSEMVNLHRQTYFKNRNVNTGLSSQFGIDSDAGIIFSFGSGGPSDSYIFPRTDGSINQVLTTDGNGQLSWETPAGGGGSVTADNGLTATGSNVQLGGTLTQTTTIDQDGNDFTLAETVPSTNGMLVFAQGLTTVTGLPGTVQGYIASNGDAARNISWLNTGDGMMHTLAGSGDPSLVRGGTEITTSYDPADTTSGLISLYAFDTPNTHVTRFQVTPTYIDAQFDPTAEFRLNGDPGTAGYVLTSNGIGIAPVWQAKPISINGSTLYSSGLTGTGNTSGNNIFLGTNAGSGATSTYNGNFFGLNAGQNATGSWGANFLGENAGYGATAAYLSNFLGRFAGQGATAARVSNFIGYGSGYLSTNAQQANFLGWSAGGEAPNASFSNFMGRESGFSADNANGSNFFGPYSGRYADNASNANFMGDHAGHGSTNASLANFFGYYAGSGATNATNSIFIGQSAGSGDSVNNTGNTDDFSILIGKSTSTGGFSNSIAIGGSAVNTATNQFMIGSTTRPIDTTIWKGSASTECTLTTGTGVSCTSDERLKTNITNLTTDTLEKVLNLKTVTYNWIQNPDSPTQIGFLAQDLEQYFPELVATNGEGKKSVYYSQMTPILVEAIREMNIKITDIGNTETSNSWRDALIAWFGNTANGITKIYADIFESKQVQTEQLCIKDVCMDRDQLYNLMNQTGSSGNVTSPTPPTPDPVIITDIPSENDPIPEPEANPEPTPEPGNSDPVPTE